MSFLLFIPYLVLIDGSHAGAIDVRCTGRLQFVLADDQHCTSVGETASLQAQIVQVIAKEIIVAGRVLVQTVAMASTTDQSARATSARRTKVKLRHGNSH